VDEVIVFHHLTREEIYQIVDLMIARLNEQASRSKIRVEITDAVRDFLAKEGYAPDMGARPLRRAVQRYIEDPLSEEVLLGRFEEGDTIVVDLDENNQILFRKGEGTFETVPEEQVQRN
jgi:ATP-dependent Clp protease ATP-binding subunit ClpA